MNAVLIADDDPVVRDIVRRYLERDGLEVLCAADGQEAWAMIGSTPINLAVLDVMMPGRDGIRLCRDIRAGRAAATTPADTPIILLTALGQEEDRVLGLESGADDYVVKPFSPRELALRVAALLRRAGLSREVSPHRAALRSGDVVAHSSSRSVTVSAVPVTLTTREFDLLVFFLTHPDVVFSRQDLLARVWNWDFGDLSTVTVHVKRLRAKLGEAHRIRTVWGQGYSWEAEDAR